MIFWSDNAPMINTLGMVDHGLGVVGWVVLVGARGEGCCGGMAWNDRRGTSAGDSWAGEWVLAWAGGCGNVGRGAGRRRREPGGRDRWERHSASPLARSDTASGAGMAGGRARTTCARRRLPDHELREQVTTAAQAPGRAAVLVDAAASSHIVPVISGGIGEPIRARPVPPFRRVQFRELRESGIRGAARRFGAPAVPGPGEPRPAVRRPARRPHRPAPPRAPRPRRW